MEPSQSGQWHFPGRIDQLEWLDLGYGTRADIDQNLREMNAFNRITGGAAAIAACLGPRAGRLARTVRVLDLGTGIGGTPDELRRWASRKGIDLQIWAVDWSLRNLACARGFLSEGAAVELVGADALRLPFPQGAVDFVISSLFLHHFSPDRLVCLLRTAFDCARHGLIMTDLVRGTAPRLAFRLVGPALARHPFTRHDGELSIRRAYRPNELLAIAQAAGLPNPQVQAQFPWRMTLVVDR